MKNYFKSIGKIFTKGGNAIASTAQSIFSKHNTSQFRDILQNTLQEQGKIIGTVGGIVGGLAGNPLTLGLTAAFAPELLPVVLGVAGAGALAGAVGGVESGSANLLSPSLYRGKDKLAVTGNVVERVGKPIKSASKIKFN